MLYILDDNTIKITRGDTAKLTISISNDLNSSNYVIGEHDTLVLTVKKSVKDPTCCFQKVIRGSNVFNIKPTDTNSLDFGKYKYDVQLTTESEEVYTIIEPSVFEILQEVTY